jgi:hypothetical protein
MKGEKEIKRTIRKFAFLFFSLSLTLFFSPSMNHGAAIPLAIFFSQI